MTGGKESLGFLVNEQGVQGVMCIKSAYIKVFVLEVS